MVRNRSRFIGCTALAAVALTACDQADPLEPAPMLKPVFSNSVAGRECFTTDFNSFNHGDVVTTLTVPLAGGVNLTVSGKRFRNTPICAYPSIYASTTRRWTLRS